MARKDQSFRGVIEGLEASGDLHRVGAAASIPRFRAWRIIVSAGTKGQAQLFTAVKGAAICRWWEFMNSRERNRRPARALEKARLHAGADWKASGKHIQPVIVD